MPIYWCLTVEQVRAIEAERTKNIKTSPSADEVEAIEAERRKASADIVPEEKPNDEAEPGADQPDTTAANPAVENPHVPPVAGVGFSR